MGRCARWVPPITRCDTVELTRAVAWAVPVLTVVVAAIVRSYLAVVALWMGLFTGMAIVLWLNGLGNIWPIVLAVGGVFLAAYVAMGAVPVVFPLVLWKRIKASRATVSQDTIRS